MTSKNELFLALVQAPTRENYLRLWEVVTSEPEYAPYSDPYGPLEQLLEAGENERARVRLAEVLGNLMLSPRIHVVAGVTARRVGDTKAADIERVFYFRCVDAILATGDGSPAAPYLVTRTTDEYDVLFHLNKELARQALTRDGDRSVDVMTCTDGSELCFDITRPLSTLSSAP